ncbi:ester hydrolase C11orf54 homolog [Athalia rosae]|uniref:ester hydrolase C11orf54 homolog n=1 Tax=Athalia rosae TaxID=37344 RepID=UPI0020341ADD|nr:ester hydrolase C11orf54 homolog [Athalia rosae]XP_012251406.2 ester hydrolase C11orf54 homolog [Athalia rosae]XP_012251407.2 ester hydrolase C11orf54 homolog [Athalia rosae]XP_012251409.2 ester hydrolase C11orf54 homolog [Athalia rosae]XP_048508884.1 ester hydrolase C11orf54 homolog [Athalia rosae]
MATLDSSKLPIVRRALHVPSLEEIKDVLARALPGNFAESTVEVVDCPDLTQQPFTLAAPGLGGGTKLLEVGGPPFLTPLVNREKVYDVKTLCQNVNHSGRAFVIGAGAGPWPHFNSNCELIMNISISPSEVKNETRIALVDQKDGKCVQQSLPKTETRFALLSNLFLSEGKPGKVIKVHAKKRTGKDNFITTIRKALAARYTKQLVGLGGTFLLKEGKAHQHIMPDFSITPLNNDADVNKWLNFYDMSAPLIMVGTLVTSETDDLDLRVQHFHSFSHHGEAGHYHDDTTPDTVEYLGYFNVGEALYRIDQPPVALGYGKD